ncbi:single-pass membrane and coiled-coil domain-containing protein 4 isoform X2 [Vespula squamosa]|uniref:Single-pass membrane and coiled-coil domain-containing protein 4 homolog n=1 Tax=Vespula squamosa TaxID=30214 RepID=A0ABD2BF76_VESSQ
MVQFTQFIRINIMRQLKGKTKETNKQKKERKKEFLENKQRIFTVVLPTMAAIFMMIAAYIYIKTRPKIYDFKIARKVPGICFSMQNSLAVIVINRKPKI